MTHQFKRGQDMPTHLLRWLDHLALDQDKKHNDCTLFLHSPHSTLSAPMQGPTTPVLVVGSGPSGLVLALALRKNGVDVRIIEKKSTYPAGQRGASLHVRSLELFHFLGVLPEVLEQSIPIPTYKIFAPPPNGDKVVREIEIAPTFEPTPEVPYPNLVLFGQNGLEAVLRKHLAEYNCHVELNTELRTFEQHEDHVVAHMVKNENGQEEQVSAKFQWIVGADGAHSVIRKQLGLQFLGELREGQNFILGDIYVENDEGILSKGIWYRWGASDDASVVLRPTNERHVWNFWLGGPNVQSRAASASRDTMLEIFYEVTGRRDLKFGDLIWIANFRPNIRMVDKFGEGRGFVVGDAAHVHPPHGGQGMNSSVQDSYNLAWKLALVTKGYASPSLLSSYSEERLPVITEMLEKTGGMLNLSVKGDVDAFWKRGGVMNMLGVNYRSSSIVLNEVPSSDEVISSYTPPPGGILRAGDRAPNAPGLVTKDGKETRLFDIFKPTYHTIISFTDPEPIARALESYPKELLDHIAILRKDSRSDSEAAQLLVDRDGHAAAIYNVADGESKVVIVRPDGVIGAIVTSVQGLNQYFSKIFS